MENIQSLIDKRQGLIADMKDLVNRAKSETRGLTADESEQFDKMEADESALGKLIKAEEILAERSAEKRSVFVEGASDDEPVPGEDKADEGKEYRGLFSKFVRRGIRGLSGDERSKFEKRGTATQVTTSGAQLGEYLVPEDWANTVYEKMLAYGGMLQAGNIMNSSNGQKWHLPIEDVTTQLGSIIGEGAVDVVQDVSWDEVTLDAYTYTSNIIKLSMELMQDNDFNVEGRIQNIIASRIGRILNQHLTTGTGTGQPQGVVTGASAGITAGSATAITRDELVDLIHSVDPAYRSGGSVGFMFNDSTLAAIKKLSFGASDDRPLWQASMVVGEPDRIEGFPYWINQDMASIATGNVSALFGDFSKYYIRRTLGMTLRRSDDRYFEERVSAFFGTCRHDAKVIDAGAIKKLTQA